MTANTLLSALLALMLCSCASQPHKADNANVSTPPAPINTDAVSPTASEQLSSGQTTVIHTSQGEVEIQPTVVDMATPNSGIDSEQTPDYEDPLEGLNRGIFSFNHFTYTYALIPLAKGYEYVTPEVVRSKIGNAFRNIREPLSLLNNLAAGEVKDAGTNLGRFLINSTIGILGLFDPATAWFDLPEAKQSLADTLAGYGVGRGPYLVLPILGQNDLRGSTSVVSEILLDPISQVSSSPDSYYLKGVDAVDSFSGQADVYQKLYQQAEDPYLYFRNQYLQGVKRDDAFDQPQQ